MENREYEAAFKRMAIDLTYARGSVKEVALELGIAPGRLSKWRQKESPPVRPVEGLTEEQREIKRLQKELREAQLEGDKPDADATSAGLKKAIRIFSRGDGRHSDL